MAETITQVTQPPEFIEAAAKPYLTELQQAVGQFKGQDLSQIMGPQFVAGLSPLQQEAINKAGGLGAYEPYLQTAAGLSGPTAYQQFMSPYQQDVIDTTLQEFDVQAAKGIPGLAAQAIEAGALECLSNEAFHEVHTEIDEIYEIKKKLEKSINNFISTNIEWVPNNYVEAEPENKELINEFFDALDDDDDVQNFYTNLK